MITEYFWSQLDDMDLEHMWFQQAGATSHTANVTINLLENKFGQRVISRNGPVGWPPWTIFCGAKSSLWLNVKLQQFRRIYAWKSSKIGFSVWTSASVTLVVLQKKSSFIHNAMERTFTAIKNFIDIQNRKNYYFTILIT